jgi:hypothetical protein
MDHEELAAGVVSMVLAAWEATAKDVQCVREEGAAMVHVILRSSGVREYRTTALLSQLPRRSIRALEIAPGSRGVASSVTIGSLGAGV